MSIAFSGRVFLWAESTVAAEVMGEGVDNPQLPNRERMCESQDVENTSVEQIAEGTGNGADSRLTGQSGRSETGLVGYLLKAEVADLLRVTTRTLDRWMAEGVVPYIKIGSGKRATVLFNWDDVRSHLERRFRIGAFQR